MRRLALPPRPNWQQKVEQVGLTFHTTDDGKSYWDESACYEFTSGEVEQIESATLALNDLCLQAVDHVVRSNLFREFGIPADFHGYLKRSWDEDEITILGRFDLLYDGVNPPKLAEYNADTPTALVEAAIVQWYWLRDVSPQADQFNSLHEKLIDAWKRVKNEMGGPISFTCIEGHLEDYLTTTYLRDTAHQAGLLTQFLPISAVGWNPQRQRFVDMHERPIHCLCKLYPWEWLMRESFGASIPGAPTRWLEPAWKSLLSNKALLPLLWKLFPDHPNLLPSSWKPLAGRHVRKPTLGREGANITIYDGDSTVASTSGGYGDGDFVYQGYHETPRFGGHTAVLGSWMVNGHACGLGIREDDGWITTNTSRFVPHRIATPDTSISARVKP
ncbi:MAG: glutathionylspermidine synthase family protein [Planctomycetes bacterium]|nr:glutathionylspermidine synthase family protein [Planctomycetota bacterium]